MEVNMYRLDKDTKLTSEFVLKIVREHNQDEGQRARHLKDYYKGKQDILKRAMKDSSKPNNKLVNPFYNTSNFTLKTLVENPNQINKNFENYLNGFSENIREEIIGKFKFEDQLKRLKEKDLLYIVLQEFVSEKADFSPEKISNIEMGYIFEELIRRFSEAHNEDAVVVDLILDVE